MKKKGPSQTGDGPFSFASVRLELTISDAAYFFKMPWTWASELSEAFLLLYRL